VVVVCLVFLIFMLGRKPAREWSWAWVYSLSLSIIVINHAWAV
jgi:hypothetical protein